MPLFFGTILLVFKFFLSQFGLHSIPNGLYSLEPTDQTLQKPQPTKGEATYLINQLTIVMTLGSYVEERSLFGLEGLASNPKD